MTVFLLVVAVLASLALAAFCAGAETAFTSVSRGRVVHMAREGSKAAGLVQGFLQDAGRTLTSLLVGNNLAHVVFSSAAAALGTRLCDGTCSISVWTAASAFAILYLGEFVPKLLCSTRPLSRSLSLAGPFDAFSALASPLTAAAMSVTNLFMRGVDAKDRVTSGDLLRILEDRKNGVRLTDFESALISRILVLRRRGQRISADSLISAIDEHSDSEDSVH